MVADLNALKQDLTRRMDGALETLKREFNGLRTGRAHPGLLEPVKVHAYGTDMPLNQVGNVGVPEARMLTVQVWDRSLVGAVEKAIRDAGLGAQSGGGWAVGAGSDPATDDRAPQRPGEDGAQIRRERACRGARCAARRDGADQGVSRRSTRSARTSAKDWTAEVQKLTDAYVKRVDEALAREGKGHPSGLTASTLRLAPMSAEDRAGRR